MSFIINYTIIITILYGWYSICFYVADKLNKSGKSDSLLVIKPIKLLKIALLIWGIPVVIYSVFALINHPYIFFVLEKPVFSWIFSFEFYIPFFMAVSVSFVGGIGSYLHSKLDKKGESPYTFKCNPFINSLLFTFVLIPFMTIFSLIIMNYNPLTLILIIGLPGALVSFIKRG